MNSGILSGLQTETKNKVFRGSNPPPPHTHTHTATVSRENCDGGDDGDDDHHHHYGHVQSSAISSVALLIIVAVGVAAIAAITAVEILPSPPHTQPQNRGPYSKLFQESTPPVSLKGRQ